MPRQTEPSVNNALGALLQPMARAWRVRSENVRAIVDQPGLQPDIILTEPGRAPVIVEAEYEPARTVEAEAKSRLGLEVVDGRRSVEAVVALKYPDAIAGADDLASALSGARLSYCVFNDEAPGISRFPEAGWLEGSVEDLTDLLRLVSVPEKAVDAAADALQQGIDRVAAILDEMDTTRPAVNTGIARLLGMTNVPQTRRMACAIIANAMVFHERIAGTQHATNIRPLNLVCGRDVPNPQMETLAEWSDILDINYFPIFSIGRDILRQLPAGHAARMLRTLELTVGEVSATGIENAHHLTGRIFQKLIADRKYLATFYTLPASAALLARLAVAKMDGIDWSDANAIGRLRIGDFACGTGALLSAVYEQVAARHERAGGDPEKLHPAMMESVLFGCDVMPSAIHITGSTLSGAYPDVEFRSSRLYTLPYGRQEDGSVKIGSLELLQSSSAMTLFNTSDPAKRTGRIGEETAAYVIADIPDEGFDLIIMNPPFTSNTKHRDSASGVLTAAFAAFDASPEDQSAMASQMKRMSKDTCYHGHAGLASAFIALADKKLRANGVLALVLPFTAINGASWSGFRELMATEYADMTVLSIAANGKDMSFSSDTGIAECLVIARKTPQIEESNRRASFVSLRRRPAGFVEASEFARLILADTSKRRLEDGPYGGIPLYCGDTPAGELLDAPTSDYEEGWGTARILDSSVAQAAHSLSNGKLWLPAEPKAREVSMAHLDHIGRRGLDSQMFISPAHKGPFTKGSASSTATYPSIWNHNAKNEKNIVCKPDSQLHVRPGMEKRAHQIWSTASRAHLSRGFRFNSQSLTVAFTAQASIGGRAWPNVKFSDTRFDLPIALWCNSTLGLLSYWWHSSRQQGGRGDMTIRSAESLPVLDFRTLSDEQLETAQKMFEDFRDLELQPAYLADADPNRARLDRRVVCDLLEFDEDTYRAVRRLAAKWCAEPSVHGGKKRPKGASLVI